MVPVVKPYVGTFYRHTFVNDFDDLDYVGVRGGIYVAPPRGRLRRCGRRLRAPARLHVGRVVDCDDVYPEVFFAYHAVGRRLSPRSSARGLGVRARRARRTARAGRHAHHDERLLRSICFQGPVFAGSRVTGLAGAYVAIAEDVDGDLQNPATPAVRPFFSYSHFDYWLGFGLTFPATLKDIDFFNSGSKTHIANSPDSFVFFVARGEPPVGRARRRAHVRGSAVRAFRRRLVGMAVERPASP